MRRRPLTILVCLSFFFLCASAALAASNFINVVVDPDSSTETGPTTAIAHTPFIPQAQVQQAAAGPFDGYLPPPPRPITKCAPPMCPPPVAMPACPPKSAPCCILPIRRPGQFEFATQVFWARLSGAVRWPAVFNGIPATEFDPSDDLGLPRNSVLLDYSARFQFRPNWALFYAIMPINISGNGRLSKSGYYGGQFIPAGTEVHSKWEYTYQRVGIMFQPIVTCNMNVSFFGSWMFNEQRIRTKSGMCGGMYKTVDRTRHMVLGGVELQKCLRTMPNGATLSCDNRVGIGFLDGSLGLDVQAGARFSVPMNAGRWGYLRGGYRYLEVTEDRSDLRLDMTLQGGFAELGIIF